MRALTPEYGGSMTVHTETERYCGCGTKLARYNGSDTCWPCQDRLRLKGLDTPSSFDLPPKMPKWARRQKDDIAMDAAVLLSVISEHTSGPFVVEDIRQHLNFNTQTYGQLTARLERDGTLVKLGTMRGVSGGIVTIWNLAERQ